MKNNVSKHDARQNLLFVQGVQKTGTSTLIGILNCHPEIFLLYETRMAQALVSRYGNQILDRFPEARRFFRRDCDRNQPYREFFAFIESKFPSHHYRYVGDKLIDFDVELIPTQPDQRVVYALRDIRTWLAKEQIVKYYRTDLDVVPATVQYLNYVIGTFRRRNACRVWMEDLINNNDLQIARLGQYLDLDLSKHTDRWWERTATTDANDPKSLSDWSRGHPSSRLPPTQLDTDVALCDCEFWEEVLDLFDRYFLQSELEATTEEFARDRAAIDRLWQHAPLPLASCYQDIQTTRLGHAPPDRAEPGVRARSGSGKKIVRSISKRWQRLVGRAAA